MGCSDSSRDEESIRTVVGNGLKLGDSVEVIEEFLRGQGWPFDYDSSRNRYQSHCPPARVDGLVEKSDVAIWIYLDENKRLKEAVVERVQTGM